MRPRKLLILFLAILFTILQSTLLNYLQIFRVKPDLLLILIIFFALYYGQTYGLLVGALCGLFAEATSGMPAGTLLFAYSLGGLILGLITRLVDSRTIIAQVSLGFIFTLALYFLTFFLLRMHGLNFPAFDTLIFTVLPASFYTACCLPFLFRFLTTILINA